MKTPSSVEMPRLRMLEIEIVNSVKLKGLTRIGRLSVYLHVNGPRQSGQSMD